MTYSLKDSVTTGKTPKSRRRLLMEENMSKLEEIKSNFEEIDDSESDIMEYGSLYSKLNHPEAFVTFEKYLSTAKLHYLDQFEPNTMRWDTPPGLKVLIDVIITKLINNHGGIKKLILEQIDIETKKLRAHIQTVQQQLEGKIK